MRRGGLRGSGRGRFAWIRSMRQSSELAGSFTVPPVLKLSQASQPLGVQSSRLSVLGQGPPGAGAGAVAAPRWMTSLSTMMPGALARLIAAKCSSLTLPSVKAPGTISVVQFCLPPGFQSRCGHRVRFQRAWSPVPHMSAWSACGSEPGGARVQPRPLARSWPCLSAAWPMSNLRKAGGGAGAPPGPKCRNAAWVTDTYQRGPVMANGAVCDWLGPGL
mmetsp:Transcript_102624/g.267858  ORF Transcript_102624/g.267858 Transcript_102624/m.267858 type:complete len:218 (+) Transcript_102624:311-964(+)